MLSGRLASLEWPLKLSDLRDFNSSILSDKLFNFDKSDLKDLNSPILSGRLARLSHEDKFNLTSWERHPIDDGKVQKLLNLGSSSGCK